MKKNCQAGLIKTVFTLCAVFLTINVRAQAPTISYSSPQSYSTGTAIKQLAPTSTGVAAAAYSSMPALLASGVTGAEGIAVTAAGVVYVSDYNGVQQLGSSVNLGAGVSGQGIAVDAAGNIYVADWLDNAIKKIPTGGGAVTSIGTGFSSPEGVAVDAAGNVYVADYGNNAVKKIPVGGGATVGLGSGFLSPTGVAVDAAGNVYVADNGTSTVKEIPVAGGAPVKLGSGFIGPKAVAVDAAGNVFVVDQEGNSALKEIPAGTSNVIILGTGFSTPFGVAVDGAGNVYVADYGNNAVKQVAPVGGYYISPALPAGLAFNSNTGVISGTPTAVNPATNYTITAYNSNGSNKATVNITITNAVTVTPPIISYASPKTYSTGTAITPLSPTSTGVAAAAYSNSPVALGGSFNNPQGVAVDAAGNVYVADYLNSAIKKLPAAGGAPVTLGSGFFFPTGVAVDASGNVYVADNSNSLVKKIPAGGGAPVVLGSGFTNPACIAVDVLGNVYVSDRGTPTGHPSVKEIPVGGGAVITLAQGLVNEPEGITVDAAGNVYFVDVNYSTVEMIPAGGGSLVALGSGLNNPDGVTIDAAGNFYVSEAGGAIKKIPASGGAPISLDSLASPASIAIDAAGNLYSVDSSKNVVKIKPAGGYYISPFLPAGLVFNANTGAISGTPTAISAASNYTVTAYNSSGSASATVNITANAASTLTFTAIAPQIYGATDFSPGAAATSGTITYSSSNTAVATIVLGKIHITGAGNSTITATNGTNNLSQVLTVNKAPLTVTANSATGVSGLSIPAFSLTYNGFVNGDTQSSLTVQPTAASTATLTSTAGNYPITVSGGTSANYAFTYVSGTLTLAPASYVTGPLPVKTYGNADFAEFGQAIAGVTYSSSNAAVATIVNGNIHIVGAGTATIIASNGTNQVSKTLTINKAPLTVTANSATGVAGLSMPAFSVTYSGFVNGDTQSSLIPQPTASSVATLASPAGNYAITVSGGASVNYAFTYVSGTLTLAPSSYVTGPLPVKTYGNADFPEFGQAIAGVTYSSSNAAVATIVNGNIHIVGAGTSTIIASNGSNQVSKTLTVNKAVITVTANDQNKTAGAANPTLTISYSGFVNGDTQSVLTTLPTASTTATTASVAGTYPISVSGGAAANYTFTYVQGTLTINNAVVTTAPVITYPGPKTYTEGQTITPLNPTNSGGAVPTTAQQLVTSFAGSGTAGTVNGTGAAASFNFGKGTMATDAGGNIYVADQANNVIRKITPGGVVSTFAGVGTAGNLNGQGTGASFNHPTGVAIDRLGNVYVADAGNNLIRMITPTGVVTTLAGSGAAGSADGTGTAATFNGPAGIASDLYDNLYIIDTNNGMVRRVAVSTGVVLTLKADNGFVNDSYISYDTTDGAIYLAGSDNYIKKLAKGILSIYAGNGAAGFANGTNLTATFNDPRGIASDLKGDLYVADFGNNVIRFITPTGVSTFAGNGTNGSLNGAPKSSSFNAPSAITIDNTGNFFVAESSVDIIRKIGFTGYTLIPGLAGGMNFNTTTGVISGTPTSVLGATNYTIAAYNSAGTGAANLTITVNNSASASANIYTIAGNGGNSYSGDGGPAAAASLSDPYSMAMDKAGNIYIATYGDNRVRRVDAVTKKITTIAGTGVAGYAGDGGLATKAELNFIGGLPGIAIDAAGNIYIGDCNNNRVREINASTQNITTIAGTGVAGYSGDGSLATAAELQGPGGILIDPANNIYIADVNNLKIREINAVSHNISTIASGLGYVERMAFDKSGNIYFGDEGKYTLNKIDAVTHNLSVIAGTGVAGYAGDGGPATAAQFAGPMVVILDSVGNFYVSDQQNNVIRKIDAVTHIISTYAGTGIPGYSGDGSSAVLAKLNESTDLLIDKAGYFYIDDLGNNVIRRIGGTAQAQSITFAALGPEVPGVADFNPGAVASSGLAVSYTSSNTAVATIVSGKIHTTGAGTTTITASQPGNVNFLAAANVQQTLTVAQTGALAPPVITYAGNQIYTAGTIITPLKPVNSGGAVPATIFGLTSTVAGQAGSQGSANGTGTAATFYNPRGIVADAAGNLYIADKTNGLIRKITPNGVVSTLTGEFGRGNSNGPDSLATFNNPAGIAIDAQGNLYVADEGNNNIRKITPAGIVSAFAGSGNSGSSNGTGSAASFNAPQGIAISLTGNIYVGDSGNNMIRMITPAGVVTTLAGNGAQGAINGAGAAATFNFPQGVAVDMAGNVYVADEDNNLIRKITPAGVVSTLAGNVNGGSSNGTGTAADFNNPQGLWVDAAGNVLVADGGNSQVREITPAGVVSTVSGTGNSGSADGAGTIATFNNPVAVTEDASGNLYVADFQNNNIRKVITTGYSISANLPSGLSFDPTTGIISGTLYNAFPATVYTIGAYNSKGSSTYSLSITVKKAAAPKIAYNTVNDLTVNIAITPLVPSNTGGAVVGSFYGLTTTAGSGGPPEQSYGLVTDAAGNTYVTNQDGIFKITPSGAITPFAGNTNGTPGSNNGTGQLASFNTPTGLAIDTAGNIYVADMGNNLIRKITPAGVVSTYAGSGATGAGNGAAASASFSSPAGVAIDAAGNIYVADMGNSLIRKISKTGVVSTFAGGNNGTGNANNGTGTAASFYKPFAITTNPSGNLYIADEGNNLVRKITPLAVVTTIAGGIAPGFNQPQGIAADAAGNVYIADTQHNLIRRIDPQGLVTTLAGNGTAGFIDGTGTAAVFNDPTGLALDAYSNLYVADSGNGAFRKIDITNYFTITPALPAGLVFDSKTGAISGTPTIVGVSTNYTVKAYNSGGSDSTVLNIRIDAPAGQLTASNGSVSAPAVHAAVSPNGDGINDVLTIDNITSYSQNKLMLMDANGTKVFEVTGYNNAVKAFDGHSNITGKLQSPGTYFYLLQYTEKGMQKSKSGFILLKY